MNLKQRSSVVEMMDDLECKGPVVDRTLRELDVINHWLGGNKVSLSAFKRLIEDFELKTVADLGCGSGYLLRQMAALASRESRSLTFTGIDANPNIIAYAQSMNTTDQTRFEVADILSPEFTRRRFDLIHCCLFLHHFTDSQLIDLFGKFCKMARFILVNDLHRHPAAYHSIRILTQLFSRSPMVRNDATISVARGFKRKELQEILRQAGITQYTLRWKWAFRWQLMISAE